MKYKYTFLVIDDNVIDQIVTKQLLKKVLDIDASNVNIANNGKEAIEWLSNYRSPFDQSLIIFMLALREEITATSWFFSICETNSILLV